METSLVAKDTCSGGTEVKEKTIGELLRELRKERGVSRMHVCEGVCAHTALARYEQNTRIPSKFMIDCLLERLEKNAARLEFISSDEEYEISQYRFKIESLIQQSQYEDVKELLKEYSKVIDVEDNLHWQYLYLKWGQLAKIIEHYTEAYEFFEKSLQCTERQYFLEQGIENKLLSNFELELVYESAETLYYLGQEKKAFFLIGQLENYLGTLHDDNEKKTRYYAEVMCWRASVEEQKGRLHFAKAYLEEAELFLMKEYRLNGLKRVLELKQQLGMPDIRDKYLAMQLVHMSKKDGEIPEEGIALWENIVKQQY